ncbi:MAG: hypothetical protein AAFO63_06680 [Pseudomonadota bacterium]
MKAIILATCLTGLCSASAMAQELTVKDVLDIQTEARAGTFTSRAEWVSMTYYLQGVIEGIGTYQAMLAEAGKPSVFCPPKSASYSIEGVMDAVKSAPRSEQARPIREVLLEYYTGRYPCTD